MPIELAPFSLFEYRRRHLITRAAMQAAGVDVLFITDPSNIAWLTGYNGWSFYVHQGVILTMEGDPFWWGRRQDCNGAKRTVYMHDDQNIGYAESYIQSTTSHPMEDLAQRFGAMGFANKRIGVEMENYYYTAKAHAVLSANLPNAKLLDVTALVNWQRGVKSNDEIAFIRNAARITDKIMNVAIELTEVGKRKNEIVAEIFKAGIVGVDDVWGDYPAIVPLLPSGKDASASHLTWDGRPMIEGEATFFELSGCCYRYHAPLSRTVFLGKPPQDILDAAKAVEEGLEVGLEQAVAGNRACDIANALDKVMAKSGIDRAGARCGYPIGLSYPPDWGERTVSLRANDKTVLEPGMTFHFMPGLWMKKWGLETTETILIKEEGPAEALCNVERKLFVKD